MIQGTIFVFRYGVGNRLKLGYTRKIIDAIHSGNLLDAEYKKSQVFGLQIPTQVEGVPSGILDPANTVSISCDATKWFSCMKLSNTWTRDIYICMIH